MNLTEKFIESLQAGSERKTIRDDGTRGFGVRVEPVAQGGRKSFFFNAKVCGTAVYKSLGDCNEISLRDARAKAIEWDSKGIAWKKAGCAVAANPFASARQIANPSNAPTFRVLMDRYLAEQIAKNSNHPDKAEKEIRWALGKYFEGWMEKPVDQITRQDVVALRNSTGDKTTMGGRLVQIARAAFEWGCILDEDGEGARVFLLPANPADKVRVEKSGDRDRVLSSEEAVWLEDALDDPQTPADLRDFVRLALMTGIRKNGILGARWQEIDFDEMLWRVPAENSKSGIAYTVDLNPDCIAILERRYEVRTVSQFIFPGTSARGFRHIDAQFQKLLQRIGKTFATNSFVIHDLRRSCASAMANAGVSPQKIALALGHSDKNLSAVLRYAKLCPQGMPEARQMGDSYRKEMLAKARARMAAEAAKVRAINE